MRCPLVGLRRAAGHTLILICDNSQAADIFDIVAQAASTSSGSGHDDRVGQFRIGPSHRGPVTVGAGDERDPSLDPGRRPLTRQSLSLRRLAEQLGVSFIPVRDALRVLEAEGLVVNPPGRSASVAPLDLEEFHSIYRVRRMLEPDLARRSVPQLEHAELDRLYQAAAEFGGAERSMDDIYDDHRAFHLALLAPAASAWDIRILMMTWAGERTVCPDRFRAARSGPP